MIKKQNKKVLSGMAGAALLLSGCAQAPAASRPEPEDLISSAPRPEGGDLASSAGAEGAVGTEGAAGAEGAVGAGEAAGASRQIGGYTLEAIAGDEVEYKKVAEVKGDFSYNQDVISPSSDVFNIYGTALTGLCAKPAFALTAGYEEGGEYYINISGSLKHAKSVTLADLQEKEETRIMSCACATGGSVVNAEVSGIPLSAVLELSELEAGANTVTVRGADGYGVPMPLSYALEKDALLVYRVNGEVLPDGQQTQLWMPGAVAKYFTRSIVEIEVTAEEETPEVITAGDAYRAHISLQNDARDAVFQVGETIVFEGYADDYDVPIAAIEISMDGGETWTVCETDGVTAERWVYWYFSYVPEEAGTYKLEARARTAEGVVSPLAAAVVFQVEGNTGV